MKRFFQKIIQTGIDAETNPDQARNIRTTNLFALIATCSFFIGFTNIFILRNNFAFIPVSVLFLINFGTFVLNYFRLYLTATYVFLINVNIIQFFVVNYYVMESGGYLYYFPLSLCVMLMYHEPKRSFHTVVHFFIMLAFIMAWLTLKEPLFLNTSITPEQTREIFIFNLCLSVLLNIILIVLVVRMITQQNKKLIFLIEKQAAREEKIRHSLKEKEVLLAEVHHRVKNNLSIVSSLLNLQLNVSANTEVQQTLMDSRNRVISMSKVHEKLYQRKDFHSIAFDEYVQELAQEINYTIARKKEIDIRFNLAPVSISLEKAIPIGLAVNEIITNTFKHAFDPSQGNAHINITMKEEKETISIAVHDNGIGFPKDFDCKPDSLGIVLIRSLTEQVDGQVSFENLQGACTTIVFSKS